MSSSEDVKLRALMMSPGFYGNWWFDEMPWFMPSLRDQILQTQEKRRGGEGASLNRARLLAGAERVRLLLDKNPTPINQMRLKHLQMLLNPQRRENTRALYEEIAKDLAESSKKGEAEACDNHFLAILKHWLGATDAWDVYRKTLDQYDQQRVRTERPSHLHALCWADLGEHEMACDNVARAAHCFRQARNLFQTRTPPPFQVFLLSREADAWVKQGRWAEADFKLNAALKLAEQQPVESLKVFALSRRGWACMEQWKTRQAEEMFRQCEEVLAKADKTDPDARVLHLDVSHGLALAKRFVGPSDQGLAAFRKLSREIGRLFRQLRMDEVGRGVDFRDSRARLVERSIHVLDCQADCNLFAEGGDLKEASDDLRRALRLCPELMAARKDAIRASLMYKQTLVLSLASAYQDLDLAAAHHQQAKALEERLSVDQIKQLAPLRSLSAALLAVFRAGKSARSVRATSR